MYGNSSISGLEDFEEPNIINQVGRGGLGNVHKLKNRNDGRYYAVHFFRFLPSMEDYPLDQILIVFQLSYPTILKYYQFNNQDPKCLISEFVPNHSVQYFIDIVNRGFAVDEWNMTNKLIIILGICLGMRYVHSKNIVHRDIKPDNILLEMNFYPKIGDFGLARRCQSHNNYCSTMGGTMLYMAPEIMTTSSENLYDGKKADIYSFGMTLYSIIYDSLPFSQATNTYSIMTDVINGKRPELIDENNLRLFNKLIIKCWNPNPEKRPDFEMILKELLKIKNQLVALQEIEEKKVDDFLEFCKSKH